MAAKRKTPVVVTSNLIVEACYQLTLAEKRVILTVISRLDSHAAAPRPETRYLIHAAEFAELFKIPKDQAYALLRDGVDRLWERALWVENERGICPHIEETKIRWVEKIGYGKAQGCIELSLTPSILPYLTALSREFTQYRLQHVVGLPTVYSIRLYELLVQWRSVGERELEVAWLRERFQLEGKYPSIKDLKCRVVDPAVAHINEHTDIWVKYTQKKRGRVIWSFIFTFGPKSEKKPDPEKPAAKKRMTTDEMARLARPGESWEELKRRLGVR